MLTRFWFQLVVAGSLQVPLNKYNISESQRNEYFVNILGYLQNTLLYLGIGVAVKTLKPQVKDLILFLPSKKVCVHLERCLGANNWS